MTSDVNPITRIDNLFKGNSAMRDAQGDIDMAIFHYRLDAGHDPAAIEKAGIVAAATAISRQIETLCDTVNRMRRERGA